MTQTKIAQISKLIKLCQESGITQFKSGDLEFTITVRPVELKVDSTDVEKMVKDLKSEPRQPTEDEFLFLSVNGEMPGDPQPQQTPS